MKEGERSMRYKNEVFIIGLNGKIGHVASTPHSGIRADHNYIPRVAHMRPVSVVSSTLRTTNISPAMSTAGLPQLSILYRSCVVDMQSGTLYLVRGLNYA